eukprot:TRINITY_DN5916_c0_g2_i1.p1 TRINITY_DN5916_c0_g2~~TRINITY_DN5916_c0_g2_i1.p1  ORF type:complete len:432 (-),score=33.10 TRINITY_DN5916_c0_g2_i1:169-1464(-)
METFRVDEIVMLLWGGFLVCLHVALSTRFLNCESMCKTIRDNIRRIREAFTSLLFPQNASDLDMVTARVMAETQLRRQTRMNASFGVCGHLLGFTLATSVLNVLMERQRWINIYQDLLICAWSSFFSILSFRGGMSSNTGCFVCTAMLMFSCSLFVQLADSSADLVLLTSVATILPRILLNMSLMNAPMTICCSALCGCANYLKLSAVATDDPCYANIQSTFLYIEVWLFVFVVLISAEIQKSTNAEILHEVTAKKDNVERSAMMTLLEHKCDVVLTLDEQLTISENVHRLAALLMFDATRFNRSASLQQFMPHASDQRRFADQFSPTTRSTSPVQSVNVRMRDAWGNILNVEIISVPFEGLDKATSFMVGIREISDMQPTQPAPLRAASDNHQTSTTLNLSLGNSFSQWSQNTIDGSIIGLPSGRGRYGL